MFSVEGAWLQVGLVNFPSSTLEALLATLAAFLGPDQATD